MYDPDETFDTLLALAVAVVIGAAVGRMFLFGLAPVRLVLL